MKTLDQLIRRYLFENGKTVHHYWLAYSYAVSAMKDFKVDIIGTSSVIELDSPNCNISDNINYSYILDVGYINAGHFISFERVNNLSVDAFAKAKHDDATETPKFIHVQVTKNTIQSRAVIMPVRRSGTFGHPIDNLGVSIVDRTINKYGENTGGYFGADLDNKTYWNVNLETGDIAITANRWNSHVAIKYMQDGGDVAPESVVHEYGHDFVVAAIRFFWSSRNKATTSYEKTIAQAEFEEEYGKYRSRILGIKPEDILQSVRRGKKMSPKP